MPSNYIADFTIRTHSPGMFPREYRLTRDGLEVWSGLHGNKWMPVENDPHNPDPIVNAVYGALEDLHRVLFDEHKRSMGCAG